jgi:hypothetical protein
MFSVSTRTLLGVWRSSRNHGTLSVIYKTGFEWIQKQICMNSLLSYLSLHKTWASWSPWLLRFSIYLWICEEWTDLHTVPLYLIWLGFDEWTVVCRLHVLSAPSDKKGPTKCLVCRLHVLSAPSDKKGSTKCLLCGKGVHEFELFWSTWGAFSFIIRECIWTQGWRGGFEWLALASNPITSCL